MAGRGRGTSPPPPRHGLAPSGWNPKPAPLRGAAEAPQASKASAQRPAGLLLRAPAEGPAAGTAERRARERRLGEHGGSFGAYMGQKNSKLRAQFDEVVEGAEATGGQLSRTFAGVTIHVNGYTRPSHSELKELMALHGGRFETYYHRDLVTHVVCDHLPDAKLKLLRAERHPKPVVRCAWVTDSLAHGRLLPVAPYLLPELRALAPGQRGLELVRGPPRAGPAADKDGAGREEGERPGAPPGGPSAEPEPEPELAAGGRGADGAGAGEGVGGGGRAGGGGAKPGEDAEQEQQAGEEVEAARARERRREMERAQRAAARLRAECDVLKGRPRTSKDKPGFVQEFYKASRLHFIGTWKARNEALVASLAATAPRPAGWGGGLDPAPGAGGARTIVHLDMDSFFASVAERGDPLFKGKPLAVCHSAHGGSAEISSANYRAREFGVRAGMFMARALELCPDLLVVPYTFEAYQEVSDRVYALLLQRTASVRAVSCDEAYLDVTGLVGGAGAGSALDLCRDLRAEIERATGCTASAGIGPNMLLARLATAEAKPDGVFEIRTEAEGEAFLAARSVRELPGVGRKLEQKLAALGVATCGDVRGLRGGLGELQRRLGPKTGEALWLHAHGRDPRPVAAPVPRKSVGAEVNWGVRFETAADAEQFLRDLAGEVAARIAAMGSPGGRTLTLKVKRRKAGAPEPPKFMGHGSCDSLSRSVTVNRCLRGAEEIRAEAARLLAALRIPPPEVRGLGLALSKLGGPSAAASEAGLGAPASVRVAPAGPATWYRPFAAAGPSRIPGPAPGPAAAEGPVADPKPRTAAATAAAPPSPTTASPPRPPPPVQQATVESLFLRASPRGPKAQPQSPAGSAFLPLPPRAELDGAVLAELPPEVRREVEQMYERHAATGPSPGRKRPRQVRFAAKAKPHNPRNQSTAKQARLHAGGITVTRAAPLAGPPSDLGLGLTMTQVDPAVLRELPPDVQRELRQALQPSRARRRAGRQPEAPSPPEPEPGAGVFAGCSGAGEFATRLERCLAEGAAALRRAQGKAEALEAEALEAEVEAALGADGAVTRAFVQGLALLAAAREGRGGAPAGGDLVAARALLRRVRRLGARPDLKWWTASAARIEADVQAAVRGAYGAPLSLEDIL